MFRLAELWANDSRGIATTATAPTTAFSYFKLVLPPCGQGKNYQDFVLENKIKPTLSHFKLVLPPWGLGKNYQDFVLENKIEPTFSYFKLGLPLCGQG